MAAKPHCSIAVITPTGDRPEAFDLCVRWVKRQKTKPDAWLVVDDGATPTAEAILQRHQMIDARVIRLEPMAGNSQHRNMERLVKEASGYGATFVFEDDDWYHAEHISTLIGRMREYDLVGEGETPYFNIRTSRWHSNRNMQHASLCATAWTNNAVPKVIDAINRGSRFIDMELWACNIKRRVWPWEGMHVGIKGMPGRFGIGCGHDNSFGKPGSMATLKTMIGDDVRYYERFSVSR